MGTDHDHTPPKTRATQIIAAITAVIVAIVCYDVYTDFAAEEGQPDGFDDIATCSEQVTNAADKPAHGPNAQLDFDDPHAPVRIGELTLTAHQHYAEAGETWALSADGDRYLVPTPAPLTDATVTHDGRTFAYITEEYKRLGTADLTDGDLDTIELPLEPTSVEASPGGDTVAVGTYIPGHLLLVDLDTGRVDELNLASPMDHQEPLTVWWTHDADNLIAFSDDPPAASIHTLDGKTVKDLTADMEQLAGSPGITPGLSPDGDRILVDGRLADIADEGTDGYETFPPECRHDGLVHDVMPVAWQDDEHVIAVETEQLWYETTFPGGDEPRGERLVITDMDGHVTEAVTDWAPDVPANLWFSRDER